jgi:hypothetical protein
VESADASISINSLELWDRIEPALQRGLSSRIMVPKIGAVCMPEVSLDILLAALQRQPASPGRPGTGSSRLRIAEPPQTFVAPKINVSVADALSTEIIYVEAAAAVGKSTIARFISSKLNIPVLDLSKIPVSTGTLQALLLELGNNQIAAFLSGQCPIIIDAIDEGRLLSGETGIEHFLITTAEFISTNRSLLTSPKLIFFGRYESIELANNWIEFASSDITSTRVQIGFFDKSSASMLIEAYAEDLARTKAASQYLQHKRAAGEVISAYFNAIANSLGLTPDQLWQEEQGKAFAGYAPVLSAVATLLVVITNYKDTTNSLVSTGGHQAWAVMETVIDQILKREQEKLVDPLKAQCQGPLPESVYGKDEQIALVGQYIEGLPLEGTRQIVLSAADSVKYQEMVRRHITDHPFVRQGEFSNAVFGSVVVSNSINNGRKISVERLASLSRQPFLWRSAARLFDDSSLIGGEFVGYILASFWNDRLTDDIPTPKIYIRPADEGGARVVVTSEPPISFNAVAPISFYGAAKNCDIDIFSEVILEGSGRAAPTSFRLQDVVLSSEIVSVRADIVRLEGSVQMEGNAISSPAHLRLVRNGAKVGWGGRFLSQFPWNKEIADLPAPHTPAVIDKLSYLVQECAIRFAMGIPIYLNADFTPVEDDPQTRWFRRYLESEFPTLISLMRKHGLASSEETYGAGFPKMKVRFSTTFGRLYLALHDPSQAEFPIAFIEEIRQQIR